MQALEIESLWTNKTILSNACERNQLIKLDDHADDNRIKPASAFHLYVPTLGHSTKNWKKSRQLTQKGCDKTWTEKHSFSIMRHSLAEKMQIIFNSSKYQMRGFRIRQIKQRIASYIWNRRGTHTCRCRPHNRRRTHTCRCRLHVERWWWSYFVRRNGLKWHPITVIIEDRQNTREINGVNRRQRLSFLNTIAKENNLQKMQWESTSFSRITKIGLILMITTKCTKSRCDEEKCDKSTMVLP